MAVVTPTTVFQDKKEGAAAAALLIDDVGVDAIYAISVRKLRSAYTGDCMRVRRNTDNAETDIGFSGEDIDVSALNTFGGSNKLYVTTWYDQSGNGFNAVQTSTALQPLIYSNGIVQDANGNNAIRTTEVGDTGTQGDYSMVINSFTARQRPTLSHVGQFIVHNPIGVVHADFQNGYAMGPYTNGATNNGFNVIRSSGGNLVALTTIPAGDTYGISTYMCDDCGTNFSNICGASDAGLGRGGTEASNTVNYSAAGFNAPTYNDCTLGYCCGNTLYTNMYMMEWINWDKASGTFSASEKTALHTNMNTYFQLQY